MSSTTSMKKCQRDSERRRRIQRRRRGRASNRPCGGGGARGSSGNGEVKRSALSSSSSSKVSDKLEALKSLIPSPEGEILKADQLFEQTADYIVRLRTQVAILQSLIDCYGSSESDNGVFVS